MLTNTNHAGYFLYHSIGMYPGKEQEMAEATAEFAEVWSAPNDKQWGFVLLKRQDFIDYWRRIINVPKGSTTTCDSVTEGLYKLIRSLPEGMLRGKRVLVAADCFPSLHFQLTGLAPKMGFTLDTVPRSDGKAWVEADDFIDRWGPDVGLALLTWVTSTASARVDLAPLVTHGRQMGSLIGVDITQAAGLIPFDAMEPKVDFVVSTSLKWMCGTPGAGILYVDKALVLELEPDGRGWFSRTTRSRGISTSSSTRRTSAALTEVRRARFRQSPLCLHCAGTLVRTMQKWRRGTGGWWIASLNAPMRSTCRCIRHGPPINAVVLSCCSSPTSQKPLRLWARWAWKVTRSTSEARWFGSRLAT